MGFRSRIKGRIKSAVGNVKALAAVINEEANHPGRPSPHMAARNPMWGGEDTPVSPEEDTAEAAESVSEPQEKSTSEDGDFWFLNYDDVDGWDVTNPKDEEK